SLHLFIFFFQAEDGIRDDLVTGVQTCALPIFAFDIDTGVSSFDLALEVAETLQGLSCMVTYNTDLFESATIARMLAHLQTLLEAILADPNRPVSDLPLLTEATRRQILVDWNDTAADFPKDACVHEAFESLVRSSSEPVAV